MLKVIEFIKSHSDWRDILSAEPYNLTITDDGLFTMLKYSQVGSDFADEMVRECRGLILDRDFEVACMAFRKFGNYGESYADEIDWATAEVLEKVDGSLIKVWNYGGEWLVSTNGTICADKADLGGGNSAYKTFGELFRAAADKEGLDFGRLDPANTYMFELVSPYNRVVVAHADMGIYHIGTRNNQTLREFETDIGIRKPRAYRADNLEDLIEMARKLKYSEEGYVVKDAQYRRIKVKSPAYVRAHCLISGMNERRLLELMHAGEAEELVGYFPEYRGYIDSLLARIDRLTEHITRIYEDKTTGVIFETRKDYAAVATSTKYPAYFFMRYDGKVKDAREWFDGLRAEKELELLETFEGAGYTQTAFPNVNE